ncbi:MAG TPA: ABC transporter ATP-binding protein [Mycobacteriales bacterium]|nr:ABC transporter ATP-binding protein [Mycobacteriales bacterium]
MAQDTEGPPKVRTDVLRRGFAVLWVAVREQPRIFALSVAGSALFGLMTVASAYIIGTITGRVVVPALESGETTTGALAAAAAAILGVAVLRVVGILGRRLGAGGMQFRLQATYRRRVTRRYLELPLSWHHRHPTGSLLSNANADVEATWFPIAPFPFAVGTVVMLIVATGALFATDWVLALVGLLVFPAVFAVNVAYSRRMSPRMTRAQQLRAEVSTMAHESFDGALVVKTLGREASEAARFGAKAVELRDALVAVGRVRGLFDPAMDALPQLGTLIVLLVGALRLRAGAVEVQDVVSVAFLFTVLAFPIRAIGWVLGELPRSVVGWDRVQRVLTATGAMPYGPEPALAHAGAAALALEDVAFAYEEAPVLRDVTFDVPAGRTVALVGPTGSGKSTVTTLVSRLVDPSHGEVRVDGRDVRELRQGALSESVALVPQTTFVFDDSVRGNITLGADVDDERVWAALRLAQADRFVDALPDRLDTMVGERGASLSGGQRQRLALARALVRRPRLLVLDDATSAVDPAVEAAILAGLRASADGTTVLVVAYRRATIALADEVVFLDRGRVVARGTHAELLSRVPGYVNLVTAYEEAERERERERAAELADEASA